MDETQAMDETQSVTDDFETEESHNRILIGWLNIKNQKHELHEGIVKIGRDPSCEILLANEKTVSKIHAVIEVEQDCCFLMDLSSRNKTKLEKKVIKPNVRYALRGGEKLCFGNVNAVYSLNTKECDRHKDKELSSSESDSTLLFEDSGLSPKIKSVNLISDASMISPTPQMSSKPSTSKLNSSSRLYKDIIPETPAASNRPNIWKQNDIINESPISQSTPFVSHTNSALKGFTSPVYLSPISDAGLDTKNIDTAHKYSSKPISKNSVTDPLPDSDESTDIEDFFDLSNKEKACTPTRKVPRSKDDGDDIFNMATQPFVKVTQSHTDPEGKQSNSADNTQEVLDAFREQDRSADNTQDILMAFDQPSQKVQESDDCHVASTQAFDRTDSGTIFRRPFDSPSKIRKQTTHSPKFVEHRFHSKMEVDIDEVDANKVESSVDCVENEDDDIFNMPTQPFKSSVLSVERLDVSSHFSSRLENSTHKLEEVADFRRPTQNDDVPAKASTTVKVAEYSEAPICVLDTTKNSSEMQLNTSDIDRNADYGSEAPTQLFEPPSEGSEVHKNDMSYQPIGTDQNQSSEWASEAPTQLFEAPAQDFETTTNDHKPQCNNTADLDQSGDQVSEVPTQLFEPPVRVSAGPDNEAKTLHSTSDQNQTSDWDSQAPTQLFEAPAQYSESLKNDHTPDLGHNSDDIHTAPTLAHDHNENHCTASNRERVKISPADSISPTLIVSGTEYGKTGVYEQAKGTESDVQPDLESQDSSLLPTQLFDSSHIAASLSKQVFKLGSDVQNCPKSQLHHGDDDDDDSDSCASETLLNELESEVPLNSPESVTIEMKCTTPGHMDKLGSGDNLDQGENEHDYNSDESTDIEEEFCPSEATQGKSQQQQSGEFSRCGDKKVDECQASDPGNSPHGKPSQSPCDFGKGTIKASPSELRDSNDVDTQRIPELPFSFSTASTPYWQRSLEAAGSTLALTKSHTANHAVSNFDSSCEIISEASDSESAESTTALGKSQYLFDLSDLKNSTESNNNPHKSDDGEPGDNIQLVKAITSPRKGSKRNIANSFGEETTQRKRINIPRPANTGALKNADCHHAVASRSIPATKSTLHNEEKLPKPSENVSPSGLGKTEVRTVSGGPSLQINAINQATKLSASAALAASSKFSSKATAGESGISIEEISRRPRSTRQVQSKKQEECADKTTVIKRKGRTNVKEGKLAHENEDQDRKLNIDPESVTAPIKLDDTSCVQRPTRRSTRITDEYESLAKRSKRTTWLAIVSEKEAVAPQRTRASRVNKTTQPSLSVATVAVTDRQTDSHKQTNSKKKIYDKVQANESHSEVKFNNLKSFSSLRTNIAVSKNSKVENLQITATNDTTPAVDIKHSSKNDMAKSEEKLKVLSAAVQNNPSTRSGRRSRAPIKYSPNKSSTSTVNLALQDLKENCASEGTPNLDEPLRKRTRNSKTTVVNNPALAGNESAAVANNPLPGKVKKLEMDKVKKLEVDKVEKLEKDKVKKLGMDKVKKLEMDKVEKLETAKVKKLETDKVKKLAMDKVKKLEMDKVEKLETAKVKKLETDKVKKLEMDKVKKLEMDKVEKLEMDKVKKLEMDKIEKLETAKVKKLETDKVKKLAMDKVKKLEMDKVEKLEMDKAKKLGKDKVKKLESVTNKIEELSSGSSEKKTRPQRGQKRKSNEDNHPVVVDLGSSCSSESDSCVTVINKGKTVMRETRRRTVQDGGEKSETTRRTSQRKKERVTDIASRTSDLSVAAETLPITKRSTRGLCKKAESVSELEISVQRQQSDCTVDSGRSSISGSVKRSNRKREEMAESTSRSSRSRRECSPSFLKESILWSPSQRQSMASKQPRVLFTSFRDEKDLKLVKDIGGKLVDTVSECSVLVTDAIRRTCKVLGSIGKGVPVVSTDWLTASKQARNFVDPWMCLIADKESEIKFGFNLKQSLEKARRRKLLTGYSLYVTDSVQPSPEQMKDLILCSGGEYLEMAPKVFAEKVLIISCEQDKRLWNVFSKFGLPVLSTEFILTGLLRQQIRIKECKLN